MKYISGCAVGFMAALVVGGLAAFVTAQIVDPSGPALYGALYLTALIALPLAVIAGAVGFGLTVRYESNYESNKEAEEASS
jgi:hypothetical protein